jgi:urea transport system substrate-binding protein
MKKRHRRHAGGWRPGVLAVAVAALLFTIGAVGCGRDDDDGGGEGGGEKVKVGMITSVTGPASVYYPALEEAAKLAVKEINADGGVNEREVELVVADTETDPARAASEARRLISEGVEFVFVTDIVAVRDATIPFFAEADIPFVYAWSYEGGPSDGGGADVCHRNFWSTGQIPSGLVPQPIEYLVKEEGFDRWFMIGSDYRWPRTMNKQARAVIEAGGGEVLGEEYIPLGTTEFAALISRLTSFPDDVAIVNNIVGGDMTAFFRQWVDAGGKNDRMIAFAFDEQQLEAIGAAAEGVWGSYDYYANLETPANQEYLDKLEAEYGADHATPTSLSHTPYGTLWLWAKAANEAGSTELDALIDAFPKVSFTDPRGEVQFDRNRHLALPNILARAGADGLYGKPIEDFGVIEPADQCPPEDYE